MSSALDADADASTDADGPEVRSRREAA